jgi:hypothetical protein
MGGERIVVSRVRKSLKDKAKPLSYFINRAQIITQYRTLLKTVALLDPGSTRDELCANVKSSFRKSQHETDERTINMLIADGMSQQDALSVLVETAVSTPPPPEQAWGSEQDGDEEWGKIGVDFPWSTKANAGAGARVPAPIVTPRKSVTREDLTRE